MRISDWSSDVCSSDLDEGERQAANHRHGIDSGAFHGRVGAGDLDAELRLRRPHGDIGRNARKRQRPAAIHQEAELGRQGGKRRLVRQHVLDRSEEHTSELQSLMRISYAVFCLKKKNNYPSHLRTEPTLLTPI